MAEFVPVETARAKEFLKNHHHGVLATRRKNGDLQMSPVTCGLDPPRTRRAGGADDCRRAEDHEER